jgi:outer membrane protein TolC
VRIAWLNVNNASQRLDITAKLLQHARKSFDLSQARYKAGASSIIELSQAQLSQTSAEIGLANARYDYLAQRSLLDYQVGRIK